LSLLKDFSSDRLSHDFLQGAAGQEAAAQEGLLDLDLRVFNLEYDDIQRMFVETGMVSEKELTYQLNVIGKKLSTK